VLYDALQVRGGAEHVALTVARCHGAADLCVGYVDRGHFSRRALAGIEVLNLNARVPTAPGQALRLLRAFARNGRLPNDYQWALYSGSYAPVAVHRGLAARNVLYCHTPPRFIYDLKPYYRSSCPAWQRPLFERLVAYVKPRYEAAVQRMDAVIANSENVRRRLQQHLGIAAQVIHPPCCIEDLKWETPQGYYLSTARVEPYKRIEHIVEAFRHMPSQHLIVTSGGSDLGRLQRLAAGTSNIRFTDWVDRATLRTLLGGTIATIYLPHDEDFGISPIESMAAGKPVIGVAEGGLLETIVPGATGLLLEPAFGVEDLIAAVQTLTPARAAEMRSACERRARAFSVARFWRALAPILDGQSHP